MAVQEMKLHMIRCCFANIPVHFCGHVLELLMKKVYRNYLEDLHIIPTSEDHRSEGTLLKSTAFLAYLLGSRYVSLPENMNIAHEF